MRGYGGWASMEKKSHGDGGWGMVVVGYTEIGNMGRNEHRMVTWHLRGVEGYGGRWKGERKGSSVGEGRGGYVGWKKMMS